MSGAGHSFSTWNHPQVAGGAGAAERAEQPLFRGRMSSLHHQGLAAALVCAAVLSACGGSSRAAERWGRRGDVDRGGRDRVRGSSRRCRCGDRRRSLRASAQTVQSKLLDDCMTNDGFSAPHVSDRVGRRPISATRSFPTCRRSRLATRSDCSPAASPFVDPQGGMSAPERRAWQARIGHCFSVDAAADALFGSAKFGQLNSGWFNVVNQVSRSAQIRALSKKAATCSAAHGVPATSVHEPVRTVAATARADLVRRARTARRCSRCRRRERACWRRAGRR